MSNWRTDLKTFFANGVVTALGDDLKYFGAWNQQKGNFEIEETRPELGVFFEFSSVGDTIPYLQETNTQQAGRVPIQVTLHVMFSTYNDQSQNLAYDYASKIVCEFSGKKHAHIHGKILKGGEIEDINHNAVYDYIINFAFFINEAVFLSNPWIDVNPDGNRLALEINGAIGANPVQYQLEMVTSGGGVVEHTGKDGYVLGDNVSDQDKDSYISINAITDINFRFVKWEVTTGGVVSEIATKLATLKMTNSIRALAQFIEQFQLTTSVVGNGTITPSSGDYDSDSEVTITATPNDPQTDVLDRIEKNSVVVSTTSPYQFVINEPSDVVAYFTALIDTFFQQVMIGVDSEIADDKYINQGNGVNADLSIIDTSKTEFLQKGYTKYLTFGEAGIMAIPYLKGTNRATNGDFYTSDYWTLEGDSEIINGQWIGTVFSDGIRQPRRYTGGQPARYYLTEFELDNDLNAFRTQVNIEDSAGKRWDKRGVCRDLIKAGDNKDRGIRLFTYATNSVVNYIESYEILEHAPTNIFFRAKGTARIHFMTDESNGSGNGYYLDIRVDGVDLVRNDLGIPTTLQSYNNPISDYDLINIDINSDIKVSLEGNEIINSNDSTYRNTLMFAIDADVNFEFSHCNFIIDDFIQHGGGSTTPTTLIIIDKSIGLDGLDSKGNELVIKANSGFSEVGTDLMQAVGNTILYNKSIDLNLKQYGVDENNPLPLSYKYFKELPKYIRELDGRKYLSEGDSTAATTNNIMVAGNSNYILTTASYSGRNTEDILTDLKNNVITDPDLISRQDVISIGCGINDYAQNVSYADYESNLDALIVYNLDENADAEIVIVGMWDVIVGGINPTKDPDTPNGSGLTYNQIRSIQIAKAQKYNIAFADVNSKNMIYPEDIPDGIHPSNSDYGSGAKKVADAIIEARISHYAIIISEDDFILDNARVDETVRNMRIIKE